MPDDQNTTQNPISTENSIPASPQEPTEPAPVDTMDSESSKTLPEALESSPNDFEVKSANIPPSDSSPTEAEKEPEIPSKNERNSKPEKASEPETPPIPGNEPLEKPEIKELEPEKEKPRTSYLKSQKWSELLVMARNAIQFRKRKKLNKIMSLFLEKSKITNDEVEKLLHVSDATATRYLSQLEKEGKIKQSGKTGKGVSYSRI